MGLNLCSGCKKMLYRQDACRRTSGECKRADGGPKAAPSPSGKASAFGADTAGSNPAGATKSAARKSAVKAQPGPLAPSDTGPAEPKRARGRPKTISDMKAYKAQKARERRARTKAEADNAKK